ncbi:MAG: hypothetical protein JOZ68_17845 [Acidimicrobiia bacterium]|nr:hypothetical protein [Acidimicrobiia bacterium]MBV8984678.1 hypothetical protein [Acidimicrobiia bacterium]MBV9042867.1 hypothetical protein [Acidimicrobiia bacterium]MBV9284241.1 hypothetical protein [Acidimicrobiia bacterium]
MLGRFVLRLVEARALDLTCSIHAGALIGSGSHVVSLLAHTRLLGG